MTAEKRKRCGLLLVETWPQFHEIYATLDEWERCGWLFMQRCCQCDDETKTRQMEMAR